MKLSKFKQILETAETVIFKIENGTRVPEHFHVTELGVIEKKFVDCGGTPRSEKAVNFQLWATNDVDHRITPEKFSKIIAISEKVLKIEDLEIEVEYQTDTIRKYDLGFDGKSFVLLSKNTKCLAQDRCGNLKQKINLSELETSSCATDGNCC